MRALLVGQFSVGMKLAAEAGDLEAARVAHEAIGRLLGLPGGVSEGAAVVDLARVRSHRG